MVDDTYKILIEVIQRVEPSWTLEEVQREAIWVLHSLPIERRSGKPNWRGSEWGIRFKCCLSEAQNHKCCYCGIPMEISAISYFVGSVYNDKRATFEHVIELSEGGSDYPENLVIACSRCNSDASNKNGRLPPRRPWMQKTGT